MHGDPRDRNVAEVRPVATVEATRAMRDHSVDPPLPGRDNLGYPGLPLHQPNQVRRRPATEESVVAAREHGAHVVGLDAGRPVSDAVDAAVVRKQESALHAPMYRGARQPDHTELSMCDVAVLSPGDQGYLTFRPVLVPHTGTKSGQIRNSPPSVGGDARVPVRRRLLGPVRAGAAPATSGRGGSPRRPGAVSRGRTCPWANPPGSPRTCCGPSGCRAPSSTRARASCARWS